jgi:hypothetical protein
MYNGYYYPLYRRFPEYPGPFYTNYPYYVNYGSSINAFQSQIASQHVINTGTASNIGQVFSPAAIY